MQEGARGPYLYRDEGSTVIIICRSPRVPSDAIAHGAGLPT